MEVDITFETNLVKSEMKIQNSTNLAIGAMEDNVMNCDGRLFMSCLADCSYHYKNQ